MHDHGWLRLCSPVRKALCCSAYLCDCRRPVLTNRSQNKSMSGTLLGPLFFFKTRRIDALYCALHIAIITEMKKSFARQCYERLRPGTSGTVASSWKLEFP